MYINMQLMYIYTYKRKERVQEIEGSSEVV